MAQQGNFTRAFCVGAFALIASPAFAHHPGGTSNTGGAGPIVTISASTLEAGHGAVAFLYEYLKFGGLGDSDLIAAASKHIHAHSIDTIRSRVGRTPPTASPTTSWCRCASRGCSAPTSARAITRTRRGHEQHGRFSRRLLGLGDVPCSANGASSTIRRPAPRRRFCSACKAPTGATNRLDQQGALFETEFQPGSGSWDVLLGAAFTQRYGAWSFDTNVLGVFAGRGAQDTRLGDRFLYNAALSYRLVGYAPPAERQASLPASAMSHGPVPHRHAHPLDKIPAAPEWTVDVVLELNGEWHDYEDTGGVKDLNSGGHVLLLSPGLAHRARRVFRFRVVRHSDRQPDERAAVEDRLSRLHRHRLCVLRKRR